MSAPRSPKSSNRLALKLVAMVVVMGAASFAAVPFYDWFCRTTGYGGTVSVAVGEALPDHVLAKSIKVRFDATTAPGMPWEFRPVQREMNLPIGEMGLAFYEAYNPTSRPVAGQATYNVAPAVAGGFFTKIHCFCFDMQVLQPGERVEMPVSFYVDPSIVDDIDGREVEGITLSYTFYEVDLPAEQAQLQPAAATGTTVSAN